MNTKKSMVIAVGLVAALMFSGVAIFARQDTSFKDGRINGDIYLGGLAIYCVNQFGQTGAPNFNDGGMTIWGVGGQKYVDMNASQLRGKQPLLGSVANSIVPATGLPVLLTTVPTANGPIWLFRTGDDQFLLQGTDTTGKFYSYAWTGCSQGTISTGGGPLLSAQPTVQPTRQVPIPAFQATSGAQGTLQATVEATRSATLVPTAFPTNGG